MKKIIYILILALTLILSSCNSVNFDMINETYKPQLKASPINGTWEVQNTIVSESKDSYNKGDNFHFNVEFFATDENIVLNPEFEILKVNWKKFISNKRNIDTLKDLIVQEEVNIIEITKDNTILAEVIPISSNKIFVDINNEILELKRIKENFTASEVNQLKVSYSEGEPIINPRKNWYMGIGISKGTSIASEGGIDYSTIILQNTERNFLVNQIDSIVINSSLGIDRYNVERRNVEGQLRDILILNGEHLSILDREISNTSNLFRINYLSPNYATLEYLQNDELNTLSTYSSNTLGGFNQLRVDEIVEFSYDRVIDAINAPDSISTFSQSIYNIGISRENGYLVVKGRVPSISNGEEYNKEFVISSNFSYVNYVQDKLDFQKLRTMIPNFVDAFKTPNENQIVVLTKDAIEVYSTERNSRLLERLFSYKLDQNSNIISISWFEERDVESLNSEVAGRRAK